MQVGDVPVMKVFMGGVVDDVDDDDDDDSG
jgi:hypothetical protein